MLGTYYRLTKPGIVYSNVMTAAAGYFFGTKNHLNADTLLALLGGNALIIACACVLNNYIDRRIDSKMTRTKKRALASGQIPGENALIYAAALGILGFLVLTATNPLTFVVGIAAIFSYVVLYGLAKRRTVHGTLIGTVPGGASLVAGYTAATGRLNTTALILFVIMLSWQMTHFYSIAIFRLEDYKAAKIPVMPAVYGIKKTKLQIIFYVFAFMFSNLVLSILGYAGLTYLIVMVVASLYWLYCGIRGFNEHNDQKWARKMFGISLIILLLFCLMLGINAYLK